MFALAFREGYNATESRSPQRQMGQSDLRVGRLVSGLEAALARVGIGSSKTAELHQGCSPIVGHEASFPPAPSRSETTGGISTSRTGGASRRAAAIDCF